MLTIFKNKTGLKPWTAGEMASELKPRLCIMTKSENGYGFHLHGEKGKNGQYIRKVEPASSAEASGLRPGDRVIEVNGGNVEKDTHYQVSIAHHELSNFIRFFSVNGLHRHV